ncbi:RING-type E3 ubiquitin-protein ligase ppil2 [Ascosphaera pollenicola]|nr:RING-type E3 ubiquitin-protein ligase ppil2 [Ascosphaera pollenicola]
MNCDKRKLYVLAAAALLRILLFVLFPTLPDLLMGRVELSTPAPILLPIFSLLPLNAHLLLSGLIYIVFDLLGAKALLDISASGASTVSRLYTTPRKDIKWDSVSIAAGFLFNPFTVATCLARSTNVFTNTAILYALSEAVTDNYLNSMLALGIASYLSLSPALLLPPLLLLCYDRAAMRDSSVTKAAISFILRHVLVFATSVVSLLFASYLITSSWAFVPATYGVQLLVPDLTPNVGLWWYFLIEIFDPFRGFFLGVFWLHLSGYVGALSLRIRRQPFFVITALLGIFAIFKPYPSVSDVSLYLALVPMFRHVFPLMRYTFFAVSTMLYASLLGPVFHHLWIYAGSGNANFFYAITLVWSLGLTILVADSIFAVLRDEVEVERPEMKGREIKQI